MDIEKIIQLIDKVAQAPISSLNIEEGSLKISIEKNNGMMQTVTSPVQVVPETMPLETAPKAATAPETVPVQAQEEEEVQTEEVQMITSPIVGVFYAASSPDAQPYVKVGDHISKGQVVGIVEAMKLMNEIESEVSGEVIEILVKNGEAVEFGQPLFKVR